MTVAQYQCCADLLRDLYDLQGERYSGTWWFRGQAQKFSGLVPSLLRDESVVPERFEKFLLQRLKHDLQRKSEVPDRFTTDDDYLLAFAQHHGCPTRLLDFTLSPLTAAYFAASGALRATGDAPMAIFAVAQITERAFHF